MEKQYLEDKILKLKNFGNLPLIHFLGVAAQ